MTGCGCGGAKCRLAAGDERHGKNTTAYVKYGCRCPSCRVARFSPHPPHPPLTPMERQARRQRKDPAAYARLRQAITRRRRERVRNAYCGCDTRENLAAIWALDSGLCAYCGAEGTDYEHVVPLARGGWGCVSNFRVACKSCNSRKGTKPLSAFLEQLAASGVEIRPGATNSGLPCPEAAYRLARRALPASPRTFPEA